MLSAAKLSALLLPNGGHYCGPLDDHCQPQGQGSLHRADDSIEFSGEWTGGRLVVSGSRDAQGRLHGQGMEWDMRGLYSGSFDLGRRQGLGVLTLFDGRVFEGEWAGGKLNGLGVEWSKDGKVAHCGRWAHDKLIEASGVPPSKLPVGASLSAAGQHS